MNFLVALTTPIFLAHSTYGVYFLFGGACFVTVLVCFLTMPETKGKSLEEIDAAFTNNAIHRLSSATQRKDGNHRAWFGKILGNQS